MSLSPEDTGRLKKVALAGTALALAGIALKNNKVIGDRIRAASFWPRSQRVFLDLIGPSGKTITRLSGLVIRSPEGEVVDVDLTDRDYPEKIISDLETAFLDEGSASGDT